MAEVVHVAVKTAPETTQLADVRETAIPADAGLLRIESCGVGGSDPEQYRRATPHSSGYVLNSAAAAVYR